MRRSPKKQRLQCLARSQKRPPAGRVGRCAACGRAKDTLPNDIDALKAIILTQQDQNARLEALVKAFKKALFGAKSERIAPDQYELSLEDIETGIALVQAEIDADERTAHVRAPKERKPRGALPKHLPRVEVVVEPDSTTCSCGHERHVISEDFSERLDIVPAQFHVIVTRRPSYACRACEGSFTQALTFAILPT